MKKWIPYIAGAILLIALSTLLLLHKEPHKFDGRITFNPKDKIPYGTYAAYHLLQQQFPKAAIEINHYAPELWQNLSLDSSGQVLLIVNSYFNPTESELDKLTAFAQKGNAVFISCLQMNKTARLFFKIQQEEVFNPFTVKNDYGVINMYDSFAVTLDSRTYTVPLQFVYPGVSYNNRFTKYDSLFTYPLGYNGDDKMPNLLAINTQKGSIFLHTAPITFTNFFVLYNNNHQYYEKLMSLFPANTKRIVWDEYFLLYKQKNRDNKDYKGLLSVLLSHKNFYDAFWMLIILLALYFLTEIKRRQRLIPEYNRPANDSLKFVTTIGKLYYEKGDHKNLAEKLTHFFLDYVRNKYKLPTNELNTAFVQQLSLKTGIPAEELNKLMDMLIHIKLSDRLSEQQLLQYHQQLENFYSKA
ncbi:DUF4350 domain-containing protein [Ilyomonas limi]|nr:DUF4350 domain-containing protein [Ilyomonas limi]